jgi:serine/threonine-protein kinase RsbW
VLVEQRRRNGNAQGHVELVLPAEPSMIRLARLVATGIASAARFEPDAVEDVRIGVDELCSALIEAGGASPLQLEFSCWGGALEVFGQTRAPQIANTQRYALSRQILAVVVDEHRVDVDGYDIRFWIRKVGHSSS